jgi:hypothetical protein
LPGVDALSLVRWKALVITHIPAHSIDIFHGNGFFSLLGFLMLVSLESLAMSRGQKPLLLGGPACKSMGTLTAQPTSALERSLHGSEETSRKMCFVFIRQEHA